MANDTIQATLIMRAELPVVCGKAGVAMTCAASIRGCTDRHVVNRMIRRDRVMAGRAVHAFRL
jgi:hypothetical protein